MAPTWKLLPFIVAACLVLSYLANYAFAQNLCSAAKMRQTFKEMKEVNCPNCGEYFHCKGNYEAVHECSGTFKDITAGAISNGEWLAAGEEDSKGNNEANRFGRGGGDCAEMYLHRNGCNYDPASKNCGK